MFWNDTSPPPAEPARVCEHPVPHGALRWLIALVQYYGAWPHPADPRRVVGMDRLVPAAVAMERFWEVARGQGCERGVVPDHVVRDPAMTAFLELLDSVRAPAEAALRRIDRDLTINELVDLAPREAPGGLLVWWDPEED